MINGKNAVGCVIGGMWSFGILGLGVAGGYFGRPYLENIKDYLSARESVEVQSELVTDEEMSSSKLNGIIVDDFKFTQVDDNYKFEGTRNGRRYQVGAYPIKSVGVEGSEQSSENSNLGSENSNGKRMMVYAGEVRE